MDDEFKERYESPLIEDDFGNLFLLLDTGINVDNVIENLDKPNRSTGERALEEEKLNKVRTTHFGRWLTSSGIDEPTLNLEAITHEIKSKYPIFMYEVIKESKEFEVAKCDKELLQDFFSAIVEYLLSGVSNIKTQTTDLRTYELYIDADSLVESMYTTTENSDLELLNAKYFDSKNELFKIAISLVDSLVDIYLIIWKDDSDSSGAILIEA